MTTTQHRPYRSYLLRLWQSYHDGQPHWHASLESAQTGELTLFVDLVALVRYLTQQTVVAEQEYEKEVLSRLFKDWS